MARALCLRAINSPNSPTTVLPVPVGAATRTEWWLARALMASSWKSSRGYGRLALNSSTSASGVIGLRVYGCKVLARTHRPASLEAELVAFGVLHHDRKAAPVVVDPQVGGAQGLEAGGFGVGSGFALCQGH